MSEENSFGLTEFQLSDLLKTNPKVTICDLRKKEDFAKGHIKKSLLAKFDEEKLLDVSQTSKVVLVSYDEKQAKEMASALRSHGFDTYYLIGGMRNWTLGLYCTNVSYVGTGYP
ncbi:rhodanese-like domain-containing protein [Nitrosopumilus sp. K4]|uniref:rhodanese-like domain-containing protein n=1 Tax=Nitrosopumilus sp. K4 TaxID=2795383 RepID=UPI002012B135|nr:rhodanese-like domain-containing protein [Nitrosopumilus sp. K4]